MSGDHHNRFLVICGPTAGGKSALAMDIARRTPSEIVCADAFHIYRGMDIGTAKPSAADRAEVPHHLIDVVNPSERFTVDDWLGRAEAAIADIRARGRLPLVVGGTHLYIKALLEGLFEGPQIDPALRARLAAMHPTERRRALEAADPAAAARIHPNDARRTIRALEVFHQTGTPISALQQQWDRGARPDALVVTLHWPTPELNKRINARVKQMFAEGLYDEAARLAPTLGPQAAEALGYKQLLPIVRAGAPPSPAALEEAAERIKIETRRFAKNQRTWIKRVAAGPAAIALDMPALPDQTADRLLTELARPASPA